MFCPARVCPGTVLARYRPVRAGETRGDVAFRPLRNRFFNFSDFSCTATAQHGPLSRVVQFRSSRICEYMHVFRRLCLRGVNCGSTDLDSTVILTTVARDKGRYQTSTERPMPPDQSSPARSASIRRCTDTACVKQDAVRCRGEQGCVATSMNSCLRNGSELHPRTDWLCKLSVRVVVSAWGGAATRSEPLVQPHQQKGGGSQHCWIGSARIAGQRIMELPKGSNAVIGRTSVTARPRSRFQTNGSFEGRLGSPMPPQSPVPGARTQRGSELGSDGLRCIGNQATLLQNLGQHGTQNMFQMLMAQQIAMQEMVRQAGVPGTAQAPIQLSGTASSAPTPGPLGSQFPPNAQPDPATPATSSLALGQQHNEADAGAAQSLVASTGPESLAQWQQQQELQIQAATKAASLKKDEARPRWSTKEGKLGRPKLWAPEDAWESATTNGTPKLRGRTACYAQLRYDWAAAYLQGFPEEDLGKSTLPLDEQSAHTVRLLVVGFSSLEAGTMAKGEGCAIVLKAKPDKRSELLSALSGILWDDFTDVDFEDFRQTAEQFCSARGIPVTTRWENMHREQDDAMREAEIESRISQEVQRRVTELCRQEALQLHAAQVADQDRDLTQSSEGTQATVVQAQHASPMTPTYPDPIPFVHRQTIPARTASDAATPVHVRTPASEPSSTTASYTGNPAQPTKKWQKGLPKSSTSDGAWTALIGNQAPSEPTQPSLPPTLDEPMPQPAKPRRATIRGGSATARVRSSSNRSRVNPYGTRSACRQATTEPEPADRPIAMGDGAGFAIEDDDDL